MGSKTGEPNTGRPADRTHHRIYGSDDRTRASLRRHRVSRLPDGGVDALLQNTAKQDSPILADIQALDIVVHSGQQGEFLLHHHAGSQANSADYQPWERVLHPETTAQLVPLGGLAVQQRLALLQSSMGRRRPDYRRRLAGTVGLELLPGSARRPAHHRGPGDDALQTLARRGSPQSAHGLAVLEGRRLNGEEQNIWRRWLIAHNMPRPGGRLPPPLLSAGSSGQFNEMTDARDNQKWFIDRYLDHGVKIDFWWMDAGWYENKTGWPNVGTWEVDRKRFPHGLPGMYDHAHARGVNALLWFEPERVRRGPGSTRTSGRGCWAATAGRSSFTTKIPRRGSGWPTMS